MYIKVGTLVVALDLILHKQRGLQGDKGTSVIKRWFLFVRRLKEVVTIQKGPKLEVYLP